MGKAYIKITVVAAVCALAATAPDDLGGAYTAFGVHPRTGQRYACEVRIAKAGDVYQLEWSFEQGYKYRGVGILKGDLLCVVSDSDVGYAAVVYDIGADGVLDGEVAHPGVGTTGTERLHPE
jgi:hypothetical protein